MALLDRAQAKAARGALGALSRRFLDLPPRLVHDPSLAEGHAGIALAHAALEIAIPGAGHATAARRALDRAMSAAAERPLSPSLYAGFTGIAWVAALLAGELRVPAESDPLAPIDHALEAYLARSPWHGPYDLMDGLVGLCVYALERLPRPSGHRILARAVSHLATMARRRRPGLAWRTDPSWTTAPRKEPDARAYPDYNLGVAHGLPGVIAILGRIVAADVPDDLRRRALALLEGAVAWLLAHQLPDGEVACFAWAVGPGIPKQPARLAWCYGDPGIAASLLIAARAAREPRWEQAGRRVALRAAARPLATVRHVDAGLCHGTAGVAHMFHRLWHMTREPRLAEAARLWFARALAMHAPGRGFAGFSAYRPTEERPRGWCADPGFLLGGAGIALALVSATTRTTLAWDRVLLLS